MRKKQRQNRGFTLVEIMVVVVIIGLLAVLAMPAFERARLRSQNAQLANDFRVFAGAAETFILETGEYPADGSTGTVPPGLGVYMSTGRWTGKTPVGGEWDFERYDSSITSGFGIVGYTASEGQILDFDRRNDDGSLTTGRFRKIAGDRYYLVLVE